MFDAASMRSRYKPKKPSDRQLKKIEEFQDFLYNTLKSIDKIADTELEIKVGIKAEFYESAVAEFEKLGYNIRAVKNTFDIKNRINPYEPSEIGYLQYETHSLALAYVNRMLMEHGSERMILTIIDWRRKS
ncbi:hypothetical protein [Vibrio phage VH7D]|uniref:Uncharacterized protein n=1 Tax=Vibrio phage VH7D TaxID=1262539 RepID=V9LZF5_9CAUD|nr:hypothetical protein CF80_gp268 [Vibrio phage VH7D]AGB07055.1 hypothetical protein [Vibrio phage VH7D]QNJ54666.1 hypothetical protein vBValMR10Z_125 [Vibrio phage vB_ValM_R10Z]